MKKRCVSSFYTRICVLVAMMIAVACNADTKTVWRDAQGRVLAHFFRESDAIDFSAFTDVRAIAAGGTHFALVLSDGSVKVLGENAHGEAETEGWSLAVNN